MNNVNLTGAQQAPYYTTPKTEGLINELLPKDLLVHIFTFLSKEDMQSTLSVSKSWCNLTFPAAKKQDFALLSNIVNSLINNLQPVLSNEQKGKLATLLNSDNEIKGKNLPEHRESVKAQLTKLIPIIEDVRELNSDFMNFCQNIPKSTELFQSIYKALVKSGYYDVALDLVKVDPGSNGSFIIPRNQFVLSVLAQLGKVDLALRLAEEGDRYSYGNLLFCHLEIAEGLAEVGRFEKALELLSSLPGERTNAFFNPGFQTVYAVSQLYKRITETPPHSKEKMSFLSKVGEIHPAAKAKVERGTMMEREKKHQKVEENF